MTTAGIDPHDPFEPIYSPKRIEFWLAHWEELATLTIAGGSSAHISEHLNREWFLLQARLRYCLCQELHSVDSMAVDPGCTHSPSSGARRHGVQTALCIYADLRRAADTLPSSWLATHQIWQEQRLSQKQIERRRASGRYEQEREPIFARTIAIRRMARELGWQSLGVQVG